MNILWWASDIPGVNVTPFYIAGFWVALIALAYPVAEAEIRDWLHDRKQLNSNSEDDEQW